MVNDHEFKKQFANIGIDKESVMGANGPNSLHAHAKPKEAEKPEPIQEENPQELMILKRKLEYLQNNTIAKINERFDELEKKIDAKSSSNVDYNRQMTLLKNDVEEMKRKIKCIKVVFTDDPVKKAVSSETTEKDANEYDGNPGNIKVEDYFNFSNKKFD